MSIKITSKVPEGAVPAELVSDAKFVQSKRLVEFQPQSQSTFSYSGLNEILIDINSPSDFLIPEESYFRFKTTCALLNDSADETDKYLSETGAHSLFRSAIIESGDGVQIERIDRYNLWNHLITSCSMSREEVDFVQHKVGDSVIGEAVAEDIFYTQSEANYDHTGGAAEQLLILATTADGADVYGQIKVGDVLRIETAVLNYTARVLTRVSRLAVTVEGLPAADIAANAITSIKNMSSVVTNPVRKTVANTASYEVCMQLNSFFLNAGQHIPLFLMNAGIRIRLVLERPEYCLVAPSAPGSSTGFTGASVSISNAVFVGSCYTPSSELRDQYIQMFKSEEGLTIPYMGVSHFMDIQSGSSGTFTAQLQAGKRSVRAVFGKIQNLRAETVTSATADVAKSTFTCDSIAQGLRAGASEFQVQIGSERFPLAKPMTCDDAGAAEAFLQLEKTLNHLGVHNVYSKRFDYFQWSGSQSLNPRYESGNTSDSQRFIFAADVGIADGLFSGQNCIQNPILVEYNFGSAYTLVDFDGSSNSVSASRYIHHFCLFDRLMTLSSAGMSVRE